MKKIRRILSSYLMLTLKIKNILVTNVRLWKCLYAEEKGLKDYVEKIDRDQKNYTHMKVKGEIINFSESQNSKKLYDLNIADSDLIIVELPKSGKEFAFQPETLDYANEEEKKEFEDPLANIDINGKAGLV
mmetsp:Transcript_31098/g.47491  ORF Transcript_31098/g.47491 Transcript_31098/m.47491 type:complete len:131 (-) Transcript_31098:2128-2520(-)